MSSLRIISPAMHNIDPAEEWSRLKKTYELMSEDELQAVADDGYELTEIAKQVLQAEISGRGLAIRLKDALPSRDSTPADSDLAYLCRVWDLSEAHRLKGALDSVGILSYWGPDDLDYIDQRTQCGRAAAKSLLLIGADATK
jgi:hypothetical protein